MSIDLFDVVTFCMLFVYQLEVFKYATDILVGGSKRITDIYMGATINCLLVGIFMTTSIPYAYFFAVVVVVLSIEFKCISKASWMQSICGAAIFTMNIASVNILVIVTISFIVGVSPFDILKNSEYDWMPTFFTAFTLAVFVQPIVAKIFNIEAIRRVTTTVKYSKILLIAVLGIITYETMHVITIFTEDMYTSQIILTVATVIFSVGTFYFVFAYSMILSDSLHYMEEADKAKSEKIRLETVKVKLNKKIERDALTNVYSRQFIMDLLESMVKEDSPNFSILFVDVNALKYANDTYGHEAGDRLICGVANALSKSVRAEDYIARVGGDEFVVVIGNDHKQSAEKMVERIYQHIDAQDKTEELITVSASIGSVYVNEALKVKGIDFILSEVDEDMRKNKKQHYAKKEGE